MLLRLFYFLYLISFERDYSPTVFFFLRGWFFKRRSNVLSPLGVLLTRSSLVQIVPPTLCSLDYLFWQLVLLKYWSTSSLRSQSSGCNTWLCWTEMNFETDTGESWLFAIIMLPNFFFLKPLQSVERVQQEPSIIEATWLPQRLISDELIRLSCQSQDTVISYSLGDLMDYRSIIDRFDDFDSFAIN